MTSTHEMPATFRARLDAALSRPVMLDASAIDGVRAAAGFSPRADMGDGAPSTVEPFTRANGGVAIVDICGPLAQRAWSCWMFSGDGYDAIVARVQAALDDGATTSVLLRLDSPGGEVAGCFEAVRAIRAAARTARKPVLAFADEMACSAAFAIACAADTIMLPDTGVVGSIGVIAAFVDESAALDALGVKVNVLTSGARKADGHPAMPMSDGARNALQQTIDYLATVFADEVAEARGMSAADVLGLDAATFYGPAAIAAGLADRTGSFNDALALARQQGEAQQRKRRMEAITKSLGLKADATEADIVAAIDSLTSFQLETCAAVGANDVSEAKGALAALKTRADQADAAVAEVATMKAAAEARDRVDLIEQGKREGKLSPNMVSKLVPELDTKALRAFLQHAPRVVPADPGLQPPAPTNPAARVGKTWAEMQPAERARLYQQDRAAYDALKAASEISR